MLDGILGRKSFKNKCKSALARTQTRLDAIKRKRNAMQKFLKEDIAELLRRNLDRNAYGRAEGLFNELNLSSCYDYVDECCDWISEHLKTLHDKRECPEECRVAVSSLTYAAARFADLPELRDLRTQFNLKYSDSLVSFVSKEFVEKLKSKTPTMEMKIQLIEDVAHQFSIRWNPSSLKHQLQTPSTPMDNKNNGVNDGHNPIRSMSANLQEIANNVNQTDEENITDTSHMKVRHTNSCPVVRQTSEEHIRSPFTGRVVLSPHKVPEKLGKLRMVFEEQENDEQLDSARQVKPIPKSVRTKFHNLSLSSPNFYDVHEVDTRETLRAIVPATRNIIFDLREENDVSEVDEAENSDVCTYFGKVSPKVISPSSSKSVHSPLPLVLLDQGENSSGKLGSDLPLPPGRRRYFSDSQPNSPSPSPSKEEDVKCEALSPGKSRFLPPEYASPKSPVLANTSRRHSSSNSQDDDSFAHELSERIGVLKEVKD